MSYFDFVVAKSTPRRITFLAVAMGAASFLRSWVTVYPSVRRGLTGSPALIAFEVFKVAALLAILSWVYVENRHEDAQKVRARREYAFSFAAALSVMIDSFIWLHGIWR